MSSLMKQLLRDTRVRGPKTPRITMKDLIWTNDMGFSYKKRRGGTRLGSKASFKKMLRNV